LRGPKLHVSGLKTASREQSEGSDLQFFEFEASRFRPMFYTITKPDHIMHAVAKAFGWKTALVAIGFALYFLAQS
jgi:hypothetical protein